MITKHQCTLRVLWATGQTGTAKTTGRWVVLGADGTISQITAKTTKPNALVLETDGEDGALNNGAVVALPGFAGMVQFQVASEPGAITVASILSMTDDGSVKLDTGAAGEHMVGSSYTTLPSDKAGQLIEGIMYLPSKNS